MSKKPRSLNASKHGAYSNLGLLPGEDPVGYIEHVRQVWLECQPWGPTEEGVATDIANVSWRKKNLRVYQLYAQLTKKWHPVLAGANEPGFSLDDALLRFLKQNLNTVVAHLELANTSAEAKQKLDQRPRRVHFGGEGSIAADRHRSGSDRGRSIRRARGGARCLNASLTRLWKMLLQIKGTKAVSGLVPPPNPPGQLSGPITVVEQMMPGRKARPMPRRPAPATCPSRSSLRWLRLGRRNRHPPALRPDA
jgi:hypothetical protein